MSTVTVLRLNGEKVVAKPDTLNVPVTGCRDESTQRVSFGPVYADPDPRFEDDSRRVKPRDDVVIVAW
jgi:hypothetical protein